jgi:hypothetical protein
MTKNHVPEFLGRWGNLGGIAALSLDPTTSKVILAGPVEACAEIAPECLSPAFFGPGTLQTKPRAFAGLFF